MENKLTKHPDNIFIEKLLDIKEGTSDDEWWTAIYSLIAEISSLDDSRTVDGAISYLISWELYPRAETHPEETEEIMEIINNVILPLWERELQKEESFIYLTGNTYRFSMIVLGENGRLHAEVAAAKLKTLLPSYSLIPDIFPDEQINSGIQAVMKKRENWYADMNDMFNFCTIGNDIAQFIKLCDENHWTEASASWKELKKYFDKLLLNVDLSKVNPRFIESMYEYVEKAEIETELKEKIKNHIQGWLYIKKRFGRWDNPPKWESRH